MNETVRRYFTFTLVGMEGPITRRVSINVIADGFPPLRDLREEIHDPLFPIPAENYLIVFMYEFACKEDCDSFELRED